MVFVELTPFVDFRSEYWSDEDLRALQNFLVVAPDAGDLVRGGAGLRKLRWSAQGRGKRGGARVIYYWHVSKQQERARRLDTAADQGARRFDEGC